MKDKIGRTPKPGEIVMFNHRPTAQGGHKQSPAIVHSAGSDGVILTVFGIHGPAVAQKIKEGAKPAEWQWPDDAAKTAEIAKETPALALVPDQPTAPELDPEA